MRQTLRPNVRHWSIAEPNRPLYKGVRRTARGGTHSQNPQNDPIQRATLAFGWNTLRMPLGWPIRAMAFGMSFEKDNSLDGLFFATATRSAHPQKPENLSQNDILFLYCSSFPFSTGFFLGPGADFYLDIDPTNTCTGLVLGGRVYSQRIGSDRCPLCWVEASHEESQNHPPTPRRLWPARGSKWPPHPCA